MVVNFCPLWTLKNTDEKPYLTCEVLRVFENDLTEVVTNTSIQW